MTNSVIYPLFKNTLLFAVAFWLGTAAMVPKNVISLQHALRSGFKNEQYVLFWLSIRFGMKQRR